MEWDDVCWNPHDSSYRQGQAEGFKAGNLAGYRDGQALGRTKGLEYGMELGFIRGFLNSLNHEESSKHKTDRIQRSIEKLRKALEDESLQPDEIFRKEQPGRNQEQDLQDDSEDASKLDVLAKLQRIRARFKVLTVQLGIPKFSLKEIMDEAAESSTIVQEPMVDREW
jgi:hypothetical protein